MADVIISKVYNMSLFSWGANDLVHQCETHTTYLKAVKAADYGDYQQLLKFARS